MSAQILGVNYDGKFILKVDGLRLVGVDSFSITHNISWTNIEDVSEYGKIGRARGNEEVTFTITIKNISGGDANNQLDGNVLLATKRLNRQQFQLEVTEENALPGKNDWLFRSLLCLGCVCEGQVNLVSSGRGGGDTPSVSYSGSALLTKLTLPDGTEITIPA